MTVAQLPLDLPHRIALGREDFLVGAANQVAVALVDRWPDWPSPVAMLIGPEGSGKTHLAEVWRTAAGAISISAADLANASLPDLVATRAIVVEDVDELPHEAETDLFHLINMVKEEQGHLLLTSKVSPAKLTVKLADLASRLRAAVTAELGMPDDSLLAAVLQKLFQDRQLPVPEATLRYMAMHMDRSIAGAQTLVAAIDRAALAGKRRITVPFVAEVLRQLPSSS